MNITIIPIGGEAVAAAALVSLPALQSRVSAAVSVFSILLAERIQTAASGRPGPNIVSGNLYGSISVDHDDGGGWGGATVGTDVPYGPRLEYGFYGTDSLGRNYNQPPYPFFSRAVEGSTGEFISLLQAAVNGG